MFCEGVYVDVLMVTLMSIQVLFTAQQLNINNKVFSGNKKSSSSLPCSLFMHSEMQMKLVDVQTLTSDNYD